MSSSTTSGGIGLPSLLAIVFIVLKLTNYISWSWWWVLSPIWITFCVAIFFMLICALAPRNLRRR